MSLSLVHWEILKNELRHYYHGIYTFQKNLYLLWEGKKVSRSKRVYLICFKSGTYSPNCQKNQKLIVRAINYHHVIFYLSIRFGKLLIS